MGLLLLSQVVEATHAIALVSERPEGFGYLLKDRVLEIDEFYDAVRRVGSGGTAIDPEVVSQLLRRRDSRSPLDELTPRERDVLELMAEGLSNGGVCRRLFLSPKTVESHVNDIFLKLGLAQAPDDHRRVLAVLAFSAVKHRPDALTAPEAGARVPVLAGKRQREAASAPSTLIGGASGPRTRIFISYRRDDTAASAEHLYASLTRRFGKDKVFRDVVTIAPGDDVAAEIDRAVAGTSVFIALIGRRWLTIKSRDGKRRLDDEQDFVRLEVEAGLRHATSVIPVLVDGAEMPSRDELPPSIAELASRNAFRISWHEEVGTIGREIASVERERTAREAAERAEAERLDLTAGGSERSAAWSTHTATAAFGVVIRAMEISLERQNNAKQLSPADLEKSMREHTHRDLAAEGFLFADLIHVIDFVGVKARRANARYVARSYPVASLDAAIDQLRLKRPILTGVVVTRDWWGDASVTKDTVIDFEQPGPPLGGTVCAIVSWDPRNGHVRLMTPWPTYGDKGYITLTARAAMHICQPPDMRSIEPAERPEPFTTGS